MQTVWRLVTARFADTAFSGEGASRYGGRWNGKGVSMVYTAESQSLAMLEMLAQDEPLRARYVIISAVLPDDLKVKRISVDHLPADWRNPTDRERLQTLGTAWIKSGESAVLSVPSAVIPAESNYLLNPMHPAFARIIIGEQQPFITDLRLNPAT
jgi:RES domain-containing protein